MNQPPVQPHASGDPPGACVIRVRGWFDPSWIETYDELSISVSGYQDHAPEACLTGNLTDQSALVGILVALHQFGLTLLSVEWLEPEATRDPTDR